MPRRVDVSKDRPNGESSSCWPPSEAFRRPAAAQQATDGTVFCTGVAICDEAGRPGRSVCQGQYVQVFCELEIREAIESPVGWIEIRDASGRLVHGKSSAQYETVMPAVAPGGSRLRSHFAVQLNVAPGEYRLTVGLSSTDREVYAAYRTGRQDTGAWPDGPVPMHEGREEYWPGLLTEERFQAGAREHCRVVADECITVGFDATGRRSHSGLVDLPGECEVRVVPPSAAAAADGGVESLRGVDAPTVFHVTHWKAGSQWVAQILRDCAPDRTVPYRDDIGHLPFWASRPGAIYSTVYLTREQFDVIPLPSNSHIFVAIRDLRDTLVSAYFSVARSHVQAGPSVHELRRAISRLSVEDGLLYLLDAWLPSCARIQLSWLEAGHQVIRYEDLVEHDLELFKALLVDEIGMDVSVRQLNGVIRANRFERYTGGRPRGSEDRSHHVRKGVAGDWVNHFTERVKRAFKARYGGLLVETGYEQDLTW
jgi:lipopolysaccharide transport system ATP-binding protein